MACFLRCGNTVFNQLLLLNNTILQCYHYAANPWLHYLDQGTADSAEAGLHGDHNSGHRCRNQEDIEDAGEEQRRRGRELDPDITDCLRYKRYLPSIIAGNVKITGQQGG